ncbi:MAG: metalloregulator ArsR/SmtB family transcription factor [Syntrophomonadaceae bacterium]|nr:metalloregulator ArsR/SmtB family transcription factor [Syntrophomonadaceae bacterium]
MEIVHIFKAMADETRIRMLSLLKYGELCVCDIEEVLNVQQSNASRHLNKLKLAGLIVSRKKSQWVYYRFNEDIFHAYPFLSIILNDEVSKIEICEQDFAQLKKHKESKAACD